jgi:hypothetical protein
MRAFISNVRKKPKPLTIDCSRVTKLRTMKRISKVIVYANAIVKPANDALMDGVRSATSAVIPMTQAERRLNRIETHLLTVVDSDQRTAAHE